MSKEDEEKAGVLFPLTPRAAVMDMLNRGEESEGLEDDKRGEDDRGDHHTHQTHHQQQEEGEQERLLPADLDLPDGPPLLVGSLLDQIFDDENEMKGKRTETTTDTAVNQTGRHSS